MQPPTLWTTPRQSIFLSGGVVRLKCPRLVFALLLAGSAVAAPRAQDLSALPMFRASVEMVSMAAVVRNGKGRVVSSLSRDDFEVLDAGTRRPIVDLRT